MLYCDRCYISQLKEADGTLTVYPSKHAYMIKEMLLDGKHINKTEVDYSMKMDKTYKGISSRFLNDNVFDRNGREAVILALLDAMEKEKGELTPEQSKELRNKILRVMSQPV